MIFLMNNDCRLVHMLGKPVFYIDSQIACFRENPSKINWFYKCLSAGQLPYADARYGGLQNNRQVFIRSCRYNSRKVFL